MRLIDANKIVFCNEIIADESGDMAEFLVAYKEDIGKLPTVDAVPVIRCKDCKHCIFDEEFGRYWCGRMTGCYRVEPDGFCSFGKQREV